MPLLVIEALARESAAAGRFLASLNEEDWARPTRCPPMTVLDLAAHMRRAWARIDDMLDAGPTEGEAEKDAATYFRFDRTVVSPAVVERARADAAGLGSGSGLLTSWSDLDEVISRARTAPDVVYPGALGAIRFSEFIRTRVVEMTIHHMDLRDAFGLEPECDAEALEVTGDVLRQLLGTDIRGSVDDVRFSLIGTGRAELDAAERAALGPLADMFPLLA